MLKLTKNVNTFSSFLDMKNYNNSNSFDEKIEMERKIESDKLKDILIRTKRKPTIEEKI